MKTFYRKKLPHLQPIGGTFFVTYLLKGALPKPLINKMKEEYENILMKLRSRSEKENAALEYFLKFDGELGKSKGVDYLKDDTLAKIVADAWHFFDNKKYELIAYTIMSNHVHVLFRMFEKDEVDNQIPLFRIMESQKKFTSRECNKVLGRKGIQFWENESYDRLVRDRKELVRTIEYILDNPIKAGICANRSDWKWNYIKPDYNEFM